MFIVLQTNTLVWGEKMFCTIAQNVFFLLYYTDERFIAGDERVESGRSNFLPTQLHMYATSDFQAELLPKLLLTGTHLCKQAVATLSYSPVSTLHPQVTVYTR